MRQRPWGRRNAFGFDKPRAGLQKDAPIGEDEVEVAVLVDVAVAAARRRAGRLEARNFIIAAVPDRTPEQRLEAGGGQDVDLVQERWCDGRGD